MQNFLQDLRFALRVYAKNTWTSNACDQG